MDLALNNLQWVICNKTKPNQTNRRFSFRKIISSFFISRVLSFKYRLYDKTPKTEMDTSICPVPWRERELISNRP